MKKQLIIMALMFFIFLAFMSTTIAAGPIVVKVGDATPKSFSFYPASMAFKKDVEQKIGGRVDIQYYGDGVLGDQKTLMESVVMGAVHMATIPSMVAQNMVPELKVLSLPFVWPNYEVTRGFIDGKEGKQLGDLWERRGVKTIAWGLSMSIGIMNKKREVKRPEDLKGLKIRVMQDPIFVDSMNAMGGMSVAMGLSELYFALEQGVLDGISTGPQFLTSMKIHEIAKFYTPVNMHATPLMFIMNLNFWKSLPTDIQKAFMEASKTWSKVNDDYYRDSSLKTSDGYTLKAFKEHGVTITEPDIEAFKKVTIPVVEKYRKEIGPELVDKILKVTNYKLR